MHSRQNIRPVWGFTLIELLVVVSIISLLLAMLVPTLGRIKFLTRTSICASGLHQLALGMCNYATASQGYLPRQDMGGTGRNLWDVSNDFRLILQNRYGVPHEMFFCPDMAPSRSQPGGYDYYGYFTLLGYMLWVPRLNGNVSIPPETGLIPDEIIRGPIGSADPKADAVLNPIVTDIVGTSLSRDNTLDPSTHGAEMGLSATHCQGKNLYWSNQAFMDGHAETVPGNRVRCRYGGVPVGNWFNWR